MSEGRAKVDLEDGCRVCRGQRAEAAHIIPRSRVRAGVGERPLNIIPLCRECHTKYDQGELDLLPHLSLAEQSFAVLLVGFWQAGRYMMGADAYRVING